MCVIIVGISKVYTPNHEAVLPVFIILVKYCIIGVRILLHHSCKGSAPKRLHIRNT